jgi:GTP cyclohydrolase I
MPGESILEIKHSNTQIIKRALTWQQVQKLCNRGTAPRNKKIFGVPRGGCIIASLLIQRGCIIVEDPLDADVIIDDIIDSGETKKRFSQSYPELPFWAAFHKRKTDGWISFPWESNEESGIEDNIRRILQATGNDASREGLLDTPKRVAKMYKELLTPPEFNFTTFDADGYDQMIIEKGIEFFSLCEHHMVPFFGVVHIGYIPGKKIVGLSKLARTVEYFARRLQVQERMTQQIADFLQMKLKPRGVGVVIQARHLCQEMRGVKKRELVTITSALKGVMLKNQKAREEFIQLCEH